MDFVAAAQNELLLIKTWMEERGQPMCQCCQIMKFH